MRLAAQDAYAIPASDDEAAPTRQQSLSLQVSSKMAADLFHRSTPWDKARLHAFAAPGAGRWQGAVPSKTIDKHLTSSQFSTTVGIQLGVDIFDEALICRLCGICMDTKGSHCFSCMCGGDAILRHNDTRDIIYRFAVRARLQPELEKAGLLHEPGLFLELRRPADILVEGIAVGNSLRSCKVALDVKVINAIGANHLDHTRQGPLVAAEAYREHALALNHTAARCQAQGITYEPLVFTCQGGCERHAEGIVAQIAEAVARAEFVEAAAVKADMLEQISVCLARNNARAIAQRMPLKTQSGSHQLWRALRDAAARVRGT